MTGFVNDKVCCADVIIMCLTRNAKLFCCQSLACSPFVQQIFAKHLLCARHCSRPQELNPKQSRQAAFSWSCMLEWGHPERKISLSIYNIKGQVVVSIVKKNEADQVMVSSQTADGWLGSYILGMLYFGLQDFQSPCFFLASLFFFPFQHFFSGKLCSLAFSRAFLPTLFIL